MGMWTDLETDVASIIQADGEEAFITVSGSVPVPVQIFWEGKNIASDAQGGPYAWVAATDLPSPLPQGSILRYGGTDYAIAVKEPDGHGMMMLTLKDETEL